MGPHSFKCGKLRWPKRRRRKPQKLQWGRTLSSAESSSALPRLCVPCGLQWGRTLSSAESGHGRRCLARHNFVTSMGPHSFKCGKSKANPPQDRAATALQWGRTLSSAERAENPVTGEVIYGDFNGAALFQVRKERSNQSPVQEERVTSMGPHSFKCGKRIGNFRNFLCVATSMGPHSFKCGKLRPLPPSRPQRRNFNGAALFQVRKAISQSSAWSSRSKLQWGRTLSSAESPKE